jgi:hypothetical protein
VKLRRHPALAVQRIARQPPARAALRFLAPGLVLVAVAGPARANDDVHGFVDPCSVTFVEDNTTECEHCVPRPDEPDACRTRLEPHGYTRKCRSTPGHAEPGEVWCRPRPGFSLPPPPPPPEPPPRDWMYGVPVVLAVVLGALWLFKRRRRKGRSE